MKLTRLRLIGFKSFVEPTDFAIEPGLTGVVGPNGCGKSNLVEAVRWVMGEASYKAMRAAEMDDVIFSGNTDRPSRNHAEVSVLVDNDDRKAPATFNDSETLEVSRRIMREQGSVFRVNGREVRARDVAMLFADASTGSRSPALVHQGRVGEIIQARPDQRRRVLEEAAGISGLHARRHEAELRLKAAEHNLARVEDVIGQLAAQVASLKTQARQAVRYRNISHQVRRIEALLLHLRWVAARTELGDAERTNDEAVRVVAARTGEQAQASTRQAGLAAGLPALREAEAKAAAALQRLLMAREALEREEARAKERIGELDRRLEQFAADLARERTLAADADTALNALATEEETLKSEAQTRAAQLGGVNERVAVADAALAASEKSFAALTGEFADLTARRNQLQSALRDHEQRLEKLATELANIETGLAASGTGEPDLAALIEALQVAQAALAEAESNAQAAEVAHGGARERLEAARAPLAAAERRVQRLETEAKTIGKLLAVENKKLWPPVMISTLRSITPRRRCAGRARRLIQPIRNCRTVRPPSPTMCRPRRNLRAVSIRSAWSSAPTQPAWRLRSSPASGWSRAKAISGGGTGLPLPPMRRPGRPAGSPSVAGCRRSRPSWKPRAAKSSPSAVRSRPRWPRSPPPRKQRPRRGRAGVRPSTQLIPRAKRTLLRNARSAATRPACPP
jgi:chromosome segregation protein